MASINPSQPADNGFFDGVDNDPTAKPDEPRGQARATRRALLRKRSRGSRRVEREKLKKGPAVSGWPAMEGLYPILLFLSLPAALVLAITVSGVGWPKSILIPIALGLGLWVAISALKGVELVLACMLIYLPFSKVFVVPLAPGVNGTNMLVLLGLFAAVLRALSAREKLTQWPPGTVLVVAFAILTSLSVVTISLLPGGRTYFLYSEILSYKAWIDQFVFYFILLMCIRDVETAKRCMVYVMIGSVLVVLYSVPEMLDKMGRSTIEKSRIGGPHLQSNNFGGFVAYTILPLVAFFVIYIKDLRAWLLVPYFLLTAKVLITTFSRGAYVAMVVGGLLAGWFKGRGFLAFWASVLLSLLLVFPNLMPEAIVARVDTVTSDDSSSATAEDRLDKSSSVRLVMWRAAAVMILEDPIFGKGFKGFPYLKEDYTEIAVKESDPHSMYLYIGSQMGLPALGLFLLILMYSFQLGRLHSSNETDRFIKAIGIGGASATACYAVVCIFGSRAVALNFTAYFWTMLVIMQVLKQKKTEAEKTLEPKRSRTNAHAAQVDGEQSLDSNASAAADDSVVATVYPGVSEKSQILPRTGRSAKPRKTGMRGAAAYQASIAAGNAGAEAGSEFQSESQTGSQSEIHSGTHSGTHSRTQDASASPSQRPCAVERSRQKGTLREARRIRGRSPKG